jgi:hypothetical protein
MLQGYYCSQHSGLFFGFLARFSWPSSWLFGSTMASATAWEQRVHDLANTAVDKGTGSAWQTLLTYCLQMGYFEKVTVHCRHIVVCPSNRDSYGVNPLDVHEILSDIVEVGWCPKYFDGIITDVEADEKDYVCTYNEHLVASSNGLLAPITRDEVYYMSLAGSHTTCGHR